MIYFLHHCCFFNTDHLEKIEKLFSSFTLASLFRASGANIEFPKKGMRVFWVTITVNVDIFAQLNLRASSP